MIKRILILPLIIAFAAGLYAQKSAVVIENVRKDAGALLEIEGGATVLIPPDALPQDSQVRFRRGDPADAQ
jgi:hypothetical protein